MSFKVSNFNWEQKCTQVWVYTQYMQPAYFARYNLFFINTGLHTHSIYPGQSHTSSKAITLLVSVSVHYHTEGHRRVNVLNCVCSLLYHEWCTHIVSTSYTVPCGEQIGYVLKYTKQKTLHYIWLHDLCSRWTVSTKADNSEIQIQLQAHIHCVNKFISLIWAWSMNPY